MEGVEDFEVSELLFVDWGREVAKQWYPSCSHPGPARSAVFHGNAFTESGEVALAGVAKASMVLHRAWSQEFGHHRCIEAPVSAVDEGVFFSE